VPRWGHIGVLDTPLWTPLIRGLWGNGRECSKRAIGPMGAGKATRLKRDLYTQTPTLGVWGVLPKGVP